MNIESALEDFLLACRADGLRLATITWYRSLLGAFAREYLDAGGDLATLSKLLGHRDVSLFLQDCCAFLRAWW